MTETPLQHALKNCSLHVLLMITSKALSRVGYGDVQILDRRTSRQKSRFGGHELLCQTTLGGRSVTVLVKVLRDSIRIRNLDELAGTVIRRGADSALIITPHHVTRVAKTLISEYKPLKTAVIDGLELAGMLSEARIGTRGNSDVDYAFFGEIEEASARILSFMEHP